MLRVIFESFESFLTSSNRALTFEAENWQTVTPDLRNTPFTRSSSLDELLYVSWRTS